MERVELLSRLADGEVMPLRGGEAESILAGFELLREEDTRLSGPIRILRTGEMIVVAERPEPGVLVLRRLVDRAAADTFVRDRLETYERMWDGCGCRIDYYR